MRRIGVALLVPFAFTACSLDEAGLASTAGGAAAAAGGGTAGAPPSTGGSAGTSGGGASGAAGAAGDGSGGAGGHAGGAAGSGGDTGGAAGSGGGDPCGGNCTDPNAACDGGTCTCKNGYTDTDASPASVTCVASDTIVSLKVRVGIDHGRLGNLTIKLTGPTGQVITLMSRPGFAEVADDGSDAGTGPNGASGDQTDLLAAYPITFEDGAATDAETMGTFQEGGGVAVCRDPDNQPGGTGTTICNFRPNPGAAGGPTTLAAAFATKSRLGAWKLCAGDSHYDGPTGSGLGSLRAWGLDFVTVAGAASPSNASGLNLTIPDDGYPQQVACHTLNVQ
jgi:hypothetical protein